MGAYSFATCAVTTRRRVTATACDHKSWCLDSKPKRGTRPAARTQCPLHRPVVVGPAERVIGHVELQSKRDQGEGRAPLVLTALRYLDKRLTLPSVPRLRYDSRRPSDDDCRTEQART